ncbi:MAG: DUF4349 domain-containing protein [Chthoniobacteraceae bacterium]|nr:DUF4349 domain-containing protein [Chthoniobacteraceae bacterium]
MKNRICWMVLLVCAAMLSGCATSVQHKSYAAAPAKAGDGSAEVRPDRMLIWKARLTIEVGCVADAVQQAGAMAEREGGFVESKSDRGEQSASVTLRVPSRKLKAAVASFESLGKVTFRNLEGEDVTEQYIDVDARLKNKIALRDKLKGLLEKASEVKDILAIETELNRVQADIDSMQGQIKSLKGKADFATIDLSLERKTLKGPLGYVFSGLWWGIEKLFVIRE